MAGAPASRITYTSTISLNDEGPFYTFKDALANFIERARDVRSKQILETACWIQRDGDVRPIYLGLYDVRDFGFYTRLLKGDGKAEFQPDVPEPDPDLVAALFLASAPTGSAERFIELLVAAQDAAAA